VHDVRIDATKIGMVGQAQVIVVVAERSRTGSRRTSCSTR